MSGAKSIYLVGMMGVGKSTVGALLADALGRAFVDTDLEIEREAGQSISQIFERAGEARFRELESAAVEQAFERWPTAVVALGGGVIVQPGMLGRLKERGVVVHLSARPEVLAERIGDGTSRPLLAGLSGEARGARLAALLETRLPFYEQADHRVDAEGEAADVVRRIRDVLTRRTAGQRE